MTQEQQGQKPIPHGTYSGYSNHHCRCDDCRNAHNDWHRRYRASEAGRITTMRANRKARLIQQMCAKFVQQAHPSVYENIVVEATQKANEATGKEPQ